MNLEYHARLRIDDGGDDRAPGGAITAALCGHWQHDGACRWPHLTDVAPDEHDPRTLTVHVQFEAVPDDEPEVRRRIAEALDAGSLEGPDGRTTTWSVVD
jgi:hypothetical protein